MSYGEGQEDRGDKAFSLDDSSRRAGGQNNLGGDEVVASALRTTLDVTLTRDEAEYIAAFIADDAERDDEVVRLLVGDGHAGFGLYGAHPEYAEEGAVLVKSLTPATTGSREHFAYAAALEEIARLREALEGLFEVLPVLPRNIGIQGMDAKYNAAVVAARAALKGTK